MVVGSVALCLSGLTGAAEAYTHVQAVDQSVVASVSMDNVLVRAGESRRSEEMIFVFEPVATATDVWTRWVAVTHGARAHRGPAYGWCSWYDRTTKIDERHVLDVVKTIEANPDVFGKGVIQIDDGYQKMDGDWSANDKFPSGMAAIAGRIREAGDALAHPLADCTILSLDSNDGIVIFSTTKKQQ